jgi:TonB family protein
VHSSTLKIAFALLLSIAVHSLLLIPGESEEPLLLQHTIIHARLDKQDSELIQQEKTEKESQNNPVISSKGNHSQKILTVPTKDTPTKTTHKKEVTTAQPPTADISQINSNSHAQVKALEDIEDSTYTFYRRVLKEYLGQRLEAKASYRGTVRLKIKLEYGSIATSVNIIESSGNAEVDHWARRAAIAASPYPKIPKKIGLTFEFSPTLKLGQTQ